MFFFHDFRATYERTIVFYVRSGIHQSHFCEIEEHFLGSEATWFLSPHLDLVFFFFQKNLLYKDDGIL